MAKKQKAGASEEDPPITSELKTGGRIKVIKDSLLGRRKVFYDKLLYYLDETTKKAAKASAATRPNMDAKAINLAALLGLVQFVPETFFDRFDFESPSELDAMVELMAEEGNKARLILNAWSQKPSEYEDQPSTPRSSQSRDVQRTVRGWCGNRCLLTSNLKSAQGAHILADCITRTPVRSKKFLGYLNAFWPKAYVRELRELLEQPENAVQNILVLDATAHIYWGEGLFSFRPVAGDSSDSQLVLEFRWLGREENRLVNYRKTDYSLSDNRDGYNPKAILSGDILTIRTKDPQDYPLPHIHLLDLQYHLNRALRAIGAAEVMNLLFRRGEDPGAGSDAAVDLWDFPPPTEETPSLAAYLVDMAVEQDVIKSDERELWIGRYTLQKTSLPQARSDEVS